MKKNYYAVREGKTTGICMSWEECRQAVEGYSGAEYKGFARREEAEAYLRGENNDRTEPVLTDRDLIAWVDGSFDSSLGRYAYGCIFLTPEGEEKISGSGSDPGLLPLRNVAGEMIGAMQAVRWALQNGYTSMELRYDYEGIEKWVTGVWKTKNTYTQQYADYMRRCERSISITYHKVKAHAGDVMNEAVDKLARNALREAEGI